ncbi:MAG: MATE family efflux transporter [Rhodobacteraceae bacterium]|nr:MAG: MATE family efflux transporter [Paracoccaceae bacterium]
MADQAKFLSGSLFRHVTVMSLTTSLGLMAVFAVDFIDMIFIAMLGKAELAAAIGYAGAILFFTGSFGIGMAIATGALVARALGQGDRALARSRGTNALIIGLGLGIAFAALIWVNIRPLVGALGATGETRELAVSFMQIVLPSLPVLLIGVVGGAILRAHGDARRSMMVMIIGGAVNAALDPVLIFGLDLELTGAALSSIAARITLAVLALRAIARHHGGFDRPRLGALGRDAGNVMRIAGPAVLTQLATPVGQAIVTRAMADFGEEAVAGMAIIGRLVPVAFGVLFALSGAVGPIIGQNAGAGLQDRVVRALRDALLFTAIVTVLVSAALYALRGPLEALFRLEGLSRDLVFLFAGPLALLWVFNGVIFVSNAAFNNLGHPFYSTWMNWGRHTLGTLPFVMAGAALWGAQGVLIGQALGGVAFGLLALWLSRRVVHRPLVMTDPAPFTRRGRLLAMFLGKR